MTPQPPLPFNDCTVPMHPHQEINWRYPQFSRITTARRSPARQCGAEPNARVDVGGMVAKNGTESGLGFLGSPQSKVQLRIPQRRVDIAGILLNDSLEQSDRFNRPPRLGEVFGEAPLGRRGRLTRQRQGEHRHERPGHAD